MDKKTLIKRIIGTLISLHIFPIIFSMIMPNGFVIGYLVDVFLIVATAVILLIMWLFDI